MFREPSEKRRKCLIFCESDAELTTPLREPELIGWAANCGPALYYTCCRSYGSRPNGKPAFFCSLPRPHNSNKYNIPRNESPENFVVESLFIQFKQMSTLEVSAKTHVRDGHDLHKKRLICIIRNVDCFLGDDYLSLSEVFWTLSDNI